MKRIIKGPESCEYNEGVACYPTERNCDTCGWNPEVKERRMEKMFGKPQEVESENVDRCVCCGAIIPEGRMICPACEGGTHGEDTR